MWDIGTELKGEFDAHIFDSGGDVLNSLPYRSPTNAFIERFNLEVEHGVAAALSQSGLPYPFWSYAALHWACNVAHTPNEKLGGITPYFKRHNKNHKHDLVPFGFLCSFHNDDHRKFEARASEGVIVGYA